MILLIGLAPRFANTQEFRGQLSRPGAVRNSKVFDRSLGQNRVLPFIDDSIKKEEIILQDTILSTEEQDYAGENAPFQDPPLNPLEELHYALETMQQHYFEIWLGTWPTAIDWTAAVMGTHVSASLYSLTRSLEYALPGTLSSSAGAEAERIENEINKYFSQAVAYYFGENAFAIRTQAYDDMLWVVLGWLENIKFMELHNQRHYPSTEESKGEGMWYGKQFERAFAHRAHVFYDLAKRGWDTTLCGGGMVWNPHLGPYKNAITNELFIAASIGMYLYFPGDDNCAPFSEPQHQYGRWATAQPSDQSIINDGVNATYLEPAVPHDPVYLHAAITAYDWLKNSNMTNSQGLYIDGFHIRNGKCVIRNEMVYTYNQGVLLSGLRGLWEGTGNTQYLVDGHELIRNVIAATGWSDDDMFSDAYPRRHPWSGLGRGGILEDACDSSGNCDQNGQTFKGIFFHHLTLFCEPLPLVPTIPGKTHAATRETAMLHRESCKSYAKWATYNARGAMRTRDREGRFGTWWGPHFGERNSDFEVPPLPKGATDYRNEGVPFDKLWRKAKDTEIDEDYADHHLGHTVAGYTEKEKGKAKRDRVETQDVNDRGRGRTVETQGGGIAVLRCTWELVRRYKDSKISF
jgi:hypothetical protein